MSWWKSGMKKEEGIYQEGKRIGKWIWYDEHGKIWSKHDYGDQ
jgi:antitoxin component YwqK of YwqJK toxin-antitoxin module